MTEKNDHAQRAEWIKEFAAKRRLGGAARPLMFLSRGAAGNRWHEDARSGRERLVDIYCENLPEAMLEWAARNGRRVYVVYLSARPVFGKSRPSYEKVHGDLVREVNFSEFRKGWRGNIATADVYEAHYREALLADPAFRELFRIDGVDMFDTLREIIDLAPGLTSSHLRDVKIWTDFLRALDPAAVFGGRLDTRADICAAASDAGAMTVAVKLGVGEEMMAPFAPRDQDGRFDPRPFPDVLGVWGTRQKFLIEKRFLDCPALILPTGRTRNDSFANNSETVTPEGAARAYLGLDPDARILLYGANHASRYGMAAGGTAGAPCMSLESWTSFLRAMVAETEARPNAFVIVKPHPSDDIETLAGIVETIGAERCLMLTDAAGLHNAQTLRDSTAFVSSPSSMFSEALLADSLPIQIWTPDINYLYESGREQTFSMISRTVRAPDELRALCARALDDPGFRQREIADLSDGLESILGPRDGGNALRLVEGAMAHFLKGWRARD